MRDIFFGISLCANLFQGILFWTVAAILVDMKREKDGDRHGKAN